LLDASWNQFRFNFALLIRQKIYGRIVDSIARQLHAYAMLTRSNLHGFESAAKIPGMPHEFSVQENCGSLRLDF